MPSAPRRFRDLALVAALAALPSLAGAADCPTGVRFEPDATGGVLDAGWMGFTHDKPIFGTALDVALGCAATTPPCGTCPILGAAASPAGHRLRCENDTSIECTYATEATDCGAGNACRHFVSPPQPLEYGGLLRCATLRIAGSVGGSVDVESGAFSAAVPLHADLYFGVSSPSGGGPNQGCPRCDGDVTANDQVRDGTCDAGPRMGLACDANATSPFPDFGSASFDCPPAESYIAIPFDLGTIPLSTTTQSRTLSTSSPTCGALPSLRCFCATCNNAAAEACASNADCPPSGGNPGVCGGRRCIGGSQHGTPCANTTECPSGICGRPGEPTKPNACIDDTTTPGTEACVPTGDGMGVCAYAPPVAYCANHPNRPCVQDAECDAVPGACVVSTRRCYSDNGVLGEAVTATGTATPPVGGVASPIDLATVTCLGTLGDAWTYVAWGLPGLSRIEQSGQLVFGNAEPGPTPTPTPGGGPTPTSTPGLCPLAPAPCRTPTVGGKASLQLGDKSPDDKDQLGWKWNKGAATTLAELGNPAASDGYALCLYDASGWRATMRIPAGGLCQGHDCWKTKPTGFLYRTKDGAPDGITQLMLKAGDDGKAQLQAKGKGTLLPMPALPSLASPIQVQLRNTTSGLCWGATYSAPFDKATAEQLKDKAD